MLGRPDKTSPLLTEDTPLSHSQPPIMCVDMDSQESKTTAAQKGVSRPEEEIQRLRSDNRALRRKNRVLLSGYQAGGSLLALVFLGPGLVTAARKFFQRASVRDPLPVDQTADLFAAIVRRGLAVGVLGLLIAAIPISLLWRQNNLIEQQNQYLRDQNSNIQSQLLAQTRSTRKQEEDTLLVRRNELLRVVYELEDCDKEQIATTSLYRSTEDCPPRHPGPKTRCCYCTLSAEGFSSFETCPPSESLTSAGPTYGAATSKMLILRASGLTLFG